MNIIGQPHVVTYIKNGFEQNRLAPSLLFIGPAGVGKKTVALECAKAHACESLEQTRDQRLLGVCDRCSSCKQVAQQGHPDLLLINRATQAIILNEKQETQSAIKIETIRYADRFLRLTPLNAKRRTVIIEEAENLTVEASNALLKTLEEPPASAQIILLTTDTNSLPSTIVSRCALIRFRSIKDADMATWLAEKFSMASDPALALARASLGSFSNALELMDKEPPPAIDLNDFSLEEISMLLTSPAWKREGRRNAVSFVNQLIQARQKELEAGNHAKTSELEFLFKMQRYLDSNVSPRIVIENVYLSLTGPQ